MPHYYKINKFNLVENFCKVVENDNNASKTAKILYTSRQSVCFKISSLEKDLGYKLFEREGRKLVLTEQGRLFYLQKAKNAVNIIGEIYAKKEEPIKKIKKTSKIKKFIVYASKFMFKKWNKMLVKITLKRMFFLALIGCSCLYFYLDQTNYFFDKKLQQLANPLLKEVMQKREYRISKDNLDRTEGVQVSLDVYEILTKLTQDDTYKNIVVAKFLFAEHPMTAMRFTGDSNIDKIFNNKKAIDRNTEKIYLLATQAFQYLKILLEKDKNFRAYSIYHDSLNNCTQCNILFENIKKYPDQLFAIKAHKITNFVNVNGWIIKYNKYYYLTLITNISPNHDQGNIQEQYIFWKKLTLDQLMHYDNGSYWKLIKDYNIKID